MRILILAAGAALTLSACGGNTAQNDTANISADANMMATDSNMMMDPNMSTDANMMGANTMGGGMDGNMATNGTTETNMMQQDMNTNEPDTNIANGM